MEITSALAVQAETIVTRDPGGYKKSLIPLFNPTAKEQDRCSE